MPRVETTPQLDLRISKMQDGLIRAVDALQRSAIVDGTLLADIALLGAGATTDVPHKLGRPAIRWLLVSQSAQADVWDDTVNLSADLRKLFIRLKASAAVTVSLWVF